MKWIEGISYKPKPKPLQYLIECKNCTFQANNAAKSGGAIFGEHTYLVSYSAVFKFNKAKLNGSAIHMQKTVHLNVQHCLFEMNLAQRYGGALYVVFKGTLKVNDTNFRSNRAYRDGGAIHIAEQVQMMVGNCTFEGNSASAGGSIDGAFHVQGEVFETVFARSNAVYEGGALRVIQQGYIHLANCAFKENSSPLGEQYMVGIMLQ